LRAAVLHEHGTTPRVDEFDDPRERPGCALSTCPQRAYLRLTKHAADGDIAVDVERCRLDDVADAWERQREAAGGPKMVLVP
jgi:hypothetical protein